MRPNKKKRAYCVSAKDYDYSEPVVAYNAKQAKKLAWEESDWVKEIASEDNGWIDVTVKWVKNAKDVQDLKLGVVSDLIVALKRFMFAWVEEEVCPICGDERRIYADRELDRIGCYACLYPEDDQ